METSQVDHSSLDGIDLQPWVCPHHARFFRKSVHSADVVIDQEELRYGFRIL